MLKKLSKKFRTAFRQRETLFTDSAVQDWAEDRFVRLWRLIIGLTMFASKAYIMAVICDVSLSAMRRNQRGWCSRHNAMKNPFGNVTRWDKEGRYTDYSKLSIALIYRGLDSLCKIGNSLVGSCSYLYSLRLAEAMS